MNMEIYGMMVDTLIKIAKPNRNLKISNRIAKIAQFTFN